MLFSFSHVSPSIFTSICVTVLQIMRLMIIDILPCHAAVGRWMLFNRVVTHRRTLELGGDRKLKFRAYKLKNLEKNLHPDYQSCLLPLYIVCGMLYCYFIYILNVCKYLVLTSGNVSCLQSSQVLDHRISQCSGRNERTQVGRAGRS